MAQLQVWGVSHKGSTPGREVRESGEGAIPRTEVRRKRPYTHSVYVCAACRKAHRKCIHSRTTESSSDDGESYGTAKNYLITTQKVSRIYEPAYSGVSSSVIRFYHANVAPWLISHDVRLIPAEQKLWQIEVPRLCQTESFLYEALMAVSFSFNNYQHSADFNPVEIFSLTSKALASMQTRLCLLGSHSSAESASILFLFICLLSSLTIHGPAPLSTLKMHMSGLAALCSQFGEHLVAPMAVTRDVILIGQDLSRLDVVAELPFIRRHIMLVDPLLRCVPSEEFQLDAAQEGSIFHLVLVTNHAIRLWENNLSSLRAQKVSPAFERSVHRHFSSYCFRSAISRDKLVMLGSKAFQDYVDLVRDIYEQTIFAVLKHGAQTALKGPKISSLRRDLKLLEAKLECARKICPIVRLQWSFQVLSGVRAWCDEQETGLLQRTATSGGPSSICSSSDDDSDCGSHPFAPQAYTSSNLRYPDDLIPISELLLAKIELHDYTVDYTKPC